MQRQRITVKNLLAAFWFALLPPALAAPNAPAHTYPSGATIILKIGNDLYATLDPSFKKGLDPAAISIDPSETPFIAPIEASRCGLLGQVSISKGYITLLNHIAHAKAIDRIEPGYFSQYIADLSQASATTSPPIPRNLDNFRYWKDDIIVEQTSLFNQMIGLTLALNLSHHYLAHYSKYAPQLAGAPSAPINNLITAHEWAASVQCATLNSLDCALATAGAKTLFDLVDQMPRRPAWTGYIIPQSVNIKTLNEQLSQYELDYFHGGLKAAGREPVVSVASVRNGVN